MDEEKEKQIDLIYMDKEKFTENFAKIEQIENIFTLETSSLEYPINRIIWARLNYRDPS